MLNEIWYITVINKTYCVGVHSTTPELTSYIHVTIIIVHKEIVRGVHTGWNHSVGDVILQDKQYHVSQYFRNAYFIGVTTVLREKRSRGE